MRNIQCAVIGDTAVGKTCLVSSYTKNEIPTQHQPTVYEVYQTSTMFRDEGYKLSICDVGGEYVTDSTAMQLALSSAEVILVCFAIDNPASFDNVEQKWIKEARYYCPDSPIVLVGLKSDLRNLKKSIRKDFRMKLVKSWRGHDMTKFFEHNISYYVECSPMTQENVHDVFERAIKCVTKEPSHSMCRCRCTPIRRLCL